MMIACPVFFYYTTGLVSCLEALFYFKAIFNSKERKEWQKKM
jgi:hypothetical protein